MRMKIKRVISSGMLSLMLLIGGIGAVGSISSVVYADAGDGTSYITEGGDNPNGGTTTNVIQYGNVMADAFFSKGVDNTNGFTMKWDELAGYPDKRGQDGKNHYGNDDSGTENTYEGTQVAFFLHTMQHYNAFNATSPVKPSASVYAIAAGWFQSAGEAITSGAKKVASTLTNIFNIWWWVLQFVTALGQAFYQIGDSINNTLQTWFTGFDPIAMLGLKQGASNFFTNITKSVMTTLGLTPSTFNIFRNIGIATFIVVFAFVMMREISKNSFKNMQGTRRHGTGVAVRMFTMFAIIPMTAIVLTTLHGAVTVIGDFQKYMGTSMASNTFLNVQGWAQTMNFDRSQLPIANLSGTMSGKNYIQGMKDADTTALAQNVNSQVAAKYAAIGDTSDDLKSIDQWQNAYNSNNTFDARDYINFVYRYGKGSGGTALGAAANKNNAPSAYWVTENTSQGDGGYKYNVYKNYWYTLDRYTFSASQNVTTNEASSGNFFGGAGSSNTLNNKDNGGQTDISKSGNAFMSTGSEGASGYHVTNDEGTGFNDIKNNAYNIAYTNAFNGGTGTQFTNQSMVFLLSSGLSNDGINYAPLIAPSANSNAKYTSLTNGSISQWKSVTIPAVNSATATYKVSQLNVYIAIGGFLIMAGLWGMLKTSMLTAFLELFKNFFKAFTTGNFVAALRYFTYLLSIPLSPMALSVAVILILQISTGILSALTTPLMSAVAGMAVIGDIAATSISLLTIFATVILFCYPSVKMSGRRKPYKTSIMGAIVAAPFYIANGISENLSEIERRMNPNSVVKNITHGAKQKLSSSVNGENAFKSLGKDTVKAGKAGAAAAAVVATGGAAAPAMAGMAGAGGAMAGAEVAGTSLNQIIGASRAASGALSEDGEVLNQSGNTLNPNEAPIEQAPLGDERGFGNPENPVGTDDPDVENPDIQDENEELMDKQSGTGVHINNVDEIAAAMALASAAKAVSAEQGNNAENVEGNQIPEDETVYSKEDKDSRDKSESMNDDTSTPRPNVNRKKSQSGNSLNAERDKMFDSINNSANTVTGQISGAVANALGIKSTAENGKTIADTTNRYSDALRDADFNVKTLNSDKGLREASTIIANAQKKDQGKANRTLQSLANKAGMKNFDTNSKEKLDELRKAVLLSKDGKGEQNLKALERVISRANGTTHREELAAFQKAVSQNNSKVRIVHDAGKEFNNVMKGNQAGAQVKTPVDTNRNSDYQENQALQQIAKRLKNIEDETRNQTDIERSRRYEK